MSVAPPSVGQNPAQILNAHHGYNQWRASIGLPPMPIEEFIASLGTSLNPQPAPAPPAMPNPITSWIGRGQQQAMEAYGLQPTGPAPVPAGQGLAPVTQQALPPMDQRLAQQQALFDRLGIGAAPTASAANALMPMPRQEQAQGQSQTMQPRGRSSGSRKSQSGNTFIFNYGGPGMQESPANSILQREEKARRNRNNTSRTMGGQRQTATRSRSTRGASPFNRRRMNDLY